MALVLRSLALFASAPYLTSGAKVNFYTYASADAVATMLAAGYFNDARNKLEVNDIIFAVGQADGVGDPLQLKVTAVPSSGDVTVEADTEEAGSGGRAVVPTAAGLTTGTLLPTDSFVVATSANAAHILLLPAAAATSIGKVIKIWVVPATNCELQTATGSGDTINNVDCSGGAVEALLTHTQLYVATQHLADGWLLQAFTALGAVATAIVPD